MGKFIKTPLKCYSLPFRFILEGKEKEEFTKKETGIQRILFTNPGH